MNQEEGWDDFRMLGEEEEENFNKSLIEMTFQKEHIQRQQQVESQVSLKMQQSR